MTMEQISSGRKTFCSFCKKTLVLKMYQIKKNHANVFCNKRCYGLFQRTKIKRTCQICKKKFMAVPSRLKVNGARVCSRKCHFSWQRIRPQIYGNKHHNWKGGRSIQNGYIYLKKAYGKAVGEHRLIMTEFLGRKLSRAEHVHHLNGNRLDNRIENLKVLKIGEHMSLHNKGRTRPVILCSVNNCSRPQHGRNLCSTHYWQNWKKNVKYFLENPKEVLS